MTDRTKTISKIVDLGSIKMHRLKISLYARWVFCGKGLNI